MSDLSFAPNALVNTNLRQSYKKSFQKKSKTKYLERDSYARKIHQKPSIVIQVFII